MRGTGVGIVCALALAALVASADNISPAAAGAGSSCPSRAAAVGDVRITWHAGPIEDASALEEWCRGVGPPLAVWSPAPLGGSAPPPLEELVVLTWNTHLAEGRLADLIRDLREGRLTAGRPVRHFVVLLQELFRHGDDVPPFMPGTRTAFAIKARDPAAPDAHDYAQTLRLSMVYIPSMRNGADRLEDRGNAIVSTEPLSDVVALELPLERQRRVAVGASVQVRTARGESRLNVLNAHLEPLSSPSSLWVFRNPRRRQVAAILDLLQTPRFTIESGSIGTVLGGDFNTIQGGVEEDAYAHARLWSQNLIAEDSRSTHFMGRLDYLFFRLAPDWTATTTRLNERFGSDHFPVIGRFAHASGAP